MGNGRFVIQGSEITRNSIGLGGSPQLCPLSAFFVSADENNRSICELAVPQNRAAPFSSLEKVNESLLVALNPTGHSVTLQATVVAKVMAPLAGESAVFVRKADAWVVILPPVRYAIVRASN